MTEIEALQILQGITEVSGNLPEDGSLVNEAMNMAYQALTQQVPVLPIQSAEKVRRVLDSEFYDYYCPTCGNFLAFESDGDARSGVEICKNCGRKIDWGEDKNADISG